MLLFNRPQLLARFDRWFDDRAADHPWLHDRSDYQPQPSPTPAPEPEPAPTPGPAPEPDPAPTPGVTELETHFLQLVNQTRAEAGIAPLAMNVQLAQAADDHSGWMLDTDTFSHTGVGGSSPGDRIEATGYDPRTWGENIAYVSRGEALDFADVEQLHQNLVNSPGHYANLVNANFTEIGIGLAEGDMNGRTVAIVTEVFA